MNGKTSVAVTSRSFSSHPVLRQALLERYPEANFNDTGKLLQGKDLIAFLRGKAKAIMALETLDEPILASLPDLKVVSKFGVGLDMMDLEAMDRHGVRIGYTAGVNKRSVSELAIAFMLILLRH